LKKCDLLLKGTIGAQITTSSRIKKNWSKQYVRREKLPVSINPPKLIMNTNAEILSNFGAGVKILQLKTV